MPNLKEIRGRIASVKNTRKITSAMSRIAAARLRKAELAMKSGQAYAERMEAVVAELVDGVQDPAEISPLLVERPVEHRVLVVVSADRGLCGGFNTNVSRMAERIVRESGSEGVRTSVIAVGRKSLPYLKSKDVNIIAEHPAAEPKNAVEIGARVAQDVLALYAGTFKDAEGNTVEAQEVRICFNFFKNVIAQVVTDKRLAPVEASAPADADGLAVRSFEPSEGEVLAHLLPVAVQTAVVQALFHSAAAEVAARRSAMDSATDNASELIGDLTLEYNRERQAAITKELMEIVGGAEALKG